MILDAIFSKTKSDLEAKKKNLSYLELEKLAQNAHTPKDIKEALSKEGLNIIAEVKKASPSKGLIRANFDPVKIAINYEKNKALAISVLTEEHYFMGHLNYLKAIREQVSLPLLRKDFIFDEYQILEALYYGADFILLIAKMLEAKELKRLFDFARALKLEVLFEIHDESDLEKAFFAGANIIGINHRDLNDFSMHMELCEKLLPQIPSSKLIIAESGLENKKTLLELKSQGVHGFLMGEYFMRQDDEGLALQMLLKDGQ